MNLRDILLDIRSEHGALTPKIVLNVARDPVHPLHQYAAFKWDNDEAAAEAYRLIVARELIRSVRLTWKKGADETQSVRYFHAVRSSDERQYDYEPVEDVFKDQFKRKLVVREMQRRIAELVSEYERFNEFWTEIRKVSRRKRPA